MFARLLLPIFGALILVPVAGAAEEFGQDIFNKAKGPYPRYRIPALVRSTKGTLLAFCEGRSGGDSGPIDVVLKRSTDGGKTWGSLQVVWDDGDNTCGNPCPVVDETTGTIWLLMTWNRGTDTEKTILAGTSQNVREVYVTHSTDDGKTWAKPTNISKTTRKAHWRWYATGPGNGIQLTRGKQKGRLVIPCNHSDHEAEGHYYRSHVITSDDHGKTWQIGGIHEEKTNESAIVELHDATLLQFMRSYHGKNRRAVASSLDGGANFGKVTLQEDLNTPVCQASALRYRWGAPNEPNDRGILLFSSPFGTKRQEMSVWVSRDDGKTWPQRHLVYKGAASYSSLVTLPDDQFGILFERDGEAALFFQVISIDTLNH